MEGILSGAFAGIGVGAWLEALAFVAGAFVSGKLVSFVSSRILRRLAAKTRNRVDDIVLAVVEKPLVFVVLVVGVGLGVGRLGLEGEAELWMGRIVGVLTTLALAWV